MTNFESLSYLPHCCGVVDGTFVKIVEPGDLVMRTDVTRATQPSYYLAASMPVEFLSTLMLDAQEPQVMHPHNRSQLCASLANREWDDADAKQFSGQQVSPYLVGDAAFANSTAFFYPFFSPQRR